MLNNPFESFHDTVAEAKEEREELDRLLTISTPSERALVGAIAVLMLVIGAWLFLGSVPRHVAVWGESVERGESPSAGSRSLQALAWVESGLAPQILAGQPVVIELATADGQTGALDGEIAKITAMPPPEGALAFDSRAFMHHIDILLDDGLEAAPAAGGRYRIIIDLGEQPPAALFGLTGR